MTMPAACWRSRYRQGRWTRQHFSWSGQALELPASVLAGDLVETAFSALRIAKGT